MSHRIVEEAEKLGYIVEPAKDNDGQPMSVEGHEYLQFRQPGRSFEHFRFSVRAFDGLWMLHQVHPDRYGGQSRTGRGPEAWTIGAALNDLRESRFPAGDSSEYRGEMG